MLVDQENSEEGAEKPPRYGLFPGVDPQQRQYDQFLKDLQNLLAATGARIENGAICLGSLKLIVDHDILLKAREEVIVKSGGDRRTDGRRNSVHINPKLDAQDQLKSQHVPFSQRCYRRPPKRPKRMRCGCGCGNH